MVRTRYEAVEADFQRFYGIDLGELWTGEMGPRRAARLASQLPPGSAIYRSEGLDSQVYSPEAQLLQRAIQEVRDAPDTRADVVARLKAEIRAGNYSVDADKLADRLLSGLSE